jgi:hypothetical protein
MNILLTFSGFQDPYTIGLVDQQEQPGPILSLVGAKSGAVPLSRETGIYPLSGGIRYASSSSKVHL